MDITSYSREQIEDGLKQVSKIKHNIGIKILFSPVHINDTNFGQTCEVFAHLRDHNYDTVIILESCDKELEKKIPMPSNDEFKTALGNVIVNQQLRDELCDEEDDFYIDDSAFHDGMSLFHQLPMLQCTVREPEVVSLQVNQMERTSIIRELAFVLSEVLYNRNVLIIICTEMSSDQTESLAKIKHYYSIHADSNLKNIINSDSVNISGRSALMTGLTIAGKWGLKLHFVDPKKETKKTNLLAGFAYMSSK